MSSIEPTSPVAVTGARGFIGRSVVRALSRAGVPVLEFVRGTPRDGEIEDDLTDVTRLAERFGEADVAAVCHCAWSGHPRSTGASHRAEIGTNITCTLDVALACGLARVPHLVFLSSGGGRHTGLADSPAPPYGWSKSVAAGGVLATADSFGFSATVLRPTAVYGSGQDPARLLGAVSVFASRLLSGQPLEVLGSPDNRRDFLHVDDLAKLVVRCIELRLHGEYEVGGPELVSIRQVVDALYEVSGLIPEIVLTESTGIDPQVVQLDNQRITEATGWIPIRRLTESLPEILSAYIVQLGLTERCAALLQRLAADAP